MTENNEMEVRSGARKYVGLLRGCEEVVSIGFIESRNSFFEELKKMLEKTYASENRSMTIVFDSPEDAFFASGAPSGKSSFFSGREIGARCMAVEKPLAVCFARYAESFGEYYVPYRGKGAVDGAALSVTGFVPTSLSVSHPELYGSDRV